MDHSDLGASFNGFRVKWLEPHEYDEAAVILEKYLNHSMDPLGYSEQFPDDWNKVWRGMMESGYNLSYIAVHEESGQIAAVRLATVVNRGEKRDPPQFTSPINAKIGKCVDSIFNSDQFFELFPGVDKYVDWFGLTVDPKFRQRGIAHEMYTRGLAVLKKRGYEIVKVGFISPFTRRAGHKHGYKEVARRYFHECKDDQGNVLNPESDPTDFVCMGVFDLRENSK